jgi:AraC-like DNA-binding protein
LYLGDCFNACTAPTVDELAQRLNLHPSFLSRAFKVVTGYRLSHVLRSRQLAEAERLLATTNLPIGDIARYAGFGTANTLFRRFRKHAGITPAQYRRSQR